MSLPERNDTPRALGARSSVGAVLRSPVTLVLVAAVLVTVHAGLGHKDFSLSARFGAAVMGMIAFLAFRAADSSRMPFVPYLAAYFYVAYGMATLSEQRLRATYGPMFVSDQARSMAVWACALALGIIVGVGSISRPIGRVAGAWFWRLVPSGEVAQRRGALRAWALVALLTQALLTFIGSMRGTAWTFALGIVAAPGFVQALLYADWRSSQTQVSRLWFWGYTFLTAALALGSGAMYGVAVPFVGAFILQWLGRERFRLAPVIALAVIAVLLNPAKFEYRHRVWRSGDSTTFVDRVEIWGEALVNTWGSEKTDVQENLETTRNRFSEILFVAQVFDWVPHYVPHSGFHRWRMVAYSYVPRALWPGKPELTRYFNSDYALAFGLQAEESTETTVINLPLVTEAYWTFGWIGVVIASALVGMLIGAYEGFFSPTRWAMQALGMTFLLTLPTLGHLATFYMGIAQRLFVGLGALWLVAGVTWLLSANRRTARA